MSQLPWEHIYVLRCWLEPPVQPKDELRLRISLSEVLSDLPPVHFINLEDLFSFLQTEISEDARSVDEEANRL